MKYKIGMIHSLTVSYQHNISYKGIFCIYLFLYLIPLQFANSQSIPNHLSSDIQYATEVSLNHPAGIEFDDSGNLYFAGGMMHKIFRVDQSGIISTIAGTGMSGFYGEGLPALQAYFNLPQKVCFDPSGNLYIADSHNYRIRKIDSTGMISTVAGRGGMQVEINEESAVLSNIGDVNSIVFDQNGNLFICNYNESVILKLDQFGTLQQYAGIGKEGYSGDGGPAIQAALYHPTDIAIDRDDNLYIVDQGNQCIRMVDQNGMIHTIAGNGKVGENGDGGQAIHANLSYPRGVFIDKENNLFIADYQNHRIRKVNSSGIITTIAGNGKRGNSGDGGLATLAELNNPIHVSKDHKGNVYITEKGNHCIRKIDTHGIITTVAGNVETSQPKLANSKNSEINSVTSQTDFDKANMIQSEQRNQYATEVALDPSGMVLDNDGNLYFTSGTTHKIYKVNQSGILTTFAGTGTKSFYGEGIFAIQANLNLPQKITFDPLGNMYIADSHNYRIRNIDPHGIISTIAGQGGYGVYIDQNSAIQSDIGDVNSIAFDKKKNLFISIYNESLILKLDTSGTLHRYAGVGVAGFSGDGGPAIEAKLNKPIDIALDKNDNLYILDEESQRVRMVDQNGIIHTIAGTGVKGWEGDEGQAVRAKLNGPRGIFIDKVNNVFIADYLNQVIRKIDSNGIITTIAGNGKRGFSGDGRLATHAELNSPVQITKDNEGNLYIADRFNYRIRKVDTNGIITTVVGNGEKPINNQNLERSISATSTQTPWFQQQYVFLIIVANFFLITFAVYYYLQLRHSVAKSKEELLKEKEAHRLVKNEMQQISEREKTRLGQDLHDGVIQQLTGMQFIGATLLQDNRESSEESSLYIQKLNDMLMKSIQQLRGLSRGLYPVELHKNGLNDAIQELAFTVHDLYGIACIFTSDRECTIHDDMANINMFRIVQESVNNAVKHSGANQIDLELIHDDGYVSIIIKDDGKGFDLETMDQIHSKKMGLNIMRYRAGIINAELNISSERQKGTIVQCRIQKP